MDDVLVLGGGIIPDEDVSFLKGKGIANVWGPGTFIKEIADYIREHVRN
jgi:methylmalonyl-CoA mutase C-terminal domain/subunit